MSCIPKLLELKGKNEFLQLGESPNMVEGGGEYEGYNFIITFSPLGHRCGYVAITKNHPLYNQKNLNSEKIQDLDVHGGVTFFDKPSNTFRTDKDCDDKWIGFDAGHSTDKPDIETLKMFTNNPYSDGMIAFYQKKELPDFYSLIGGEIRTKDYMIDECKKLILQLKTLENEATSPN